MSHNRINMLTTYPVLTNIACSKSDLTFEGNYIKSVTCTTPPMLYNILEIM